MLAENANQEGNLFGHNECVPATDKAVFEERDKLFLFQKPNNDPRVPSELSFVISRLGDLDEAGNPTGGLFGTAVATMGMKLVILLVDCLAQLLQRWECLVQQLMYKQYNGYLWANC